MKQLLQYLSNGKTAVEDVPVPVPRSGHGARSHARQPRFGWNRAHGRGLRETIAAWQGPPPARLWCARSSRRRVAKACSARFRQPSTDWISPWRWATPQPAPSWPSARDMTGLGVGQRVACAGSGYAVHAEYAVVPRNLLVALPAGLDFESAAFATLGAIGMHGFRLGAAPGGGARGRHRSRPAGIAYGADRCRGRMSGVRDGHRCLPGEAGSFTRHPSVHPRPRARGCPGLHARSRALMSS